MLINKKGSISIGLMLLFFAVFFFFMITFEYTLLSFLKEKNQAIADNIASSAVLKVDDCFFAQTGILRIKRLSAYMTAERIFSESYKDFGCEGGTFFEEPKMTVYVCNIVRNLDIGGKKTKVVPPSVVVVIEMKPKNKMSLLKDVNLKVVSKSQVRLKRRVCLEDLWEMSLDEINNLFVFENR